VRDYFIIGEERIADFEVIRPTLKGVDNATFFGLKNRGETTIPDGYLPLSELIKTAPTKNLAITKTITLGDRFANVFTSGTTGMPKASIQTHRKWYVCYLWYGRINMDIQSDDVFYVPIPFFHTNAMIVAWPSAASGGAALAIRRKLSISNFWKDVYKFNVSAFIYIGEICRYLMNKPPAESDTQHRIQKIVGNGLRPDIWKAFKQRFNIPEVYELYGASDGIVSYTNIFNLNCTVGLCRSEYAIVKYDIDKDEPYRNAQGFMEKVKTGEAGLLLGQINEITPFPGYVNKQNHSAVYGVALPKIDGKAGMATINSPYSMDQFDFFDFTQKIKMALPSYAVPIFIRFVSDFEKTATHKIKKSVLKQEGFAIHSEATPIYVLLPKAATYTKMTAEIVQQIEAGAILF